MSQQNRRIRKWGYLIILKTDTDFKEGWSGECVEGYIKGLQQAFKVFEHRGRVEMVYKKLELDEVSDFEARTAGTP